MLPQGFLCERHYRLKDDHMHSQASPGLRWTRLKWMQSWDATQQATGCLRDLVTCGESARSLVGIEPISSKPRFRKVICD